MTEDIIKLQGVIRCICILALTIKENLSVENKNYKEIEALNNLILKYIEDVDKDLLEKLQQYLERTTNE